MEKILIEKVEALLNGCNVMSIASSDGNVPWAASVFFVADTCFNLHFISAQSSRHSQNISNNPYAAVTINKDDSEWMNISGLQIEGSVSISPTAERDSVLALYLEKFPNVSALRDKPANKQEELIAFRLINSDYYRLEPRTIRLIDNSMGFGFKQEIQVSEYLANARLDQSNAVSPQRS